MTIIKARLKDQVLTVTSAPVVASGGVEEDIASFDFDDTWTGYTKKAVFYRDKSSVYHVAVGSDNTAVVPWEVLRQEGFMFLGVFGTKGSEIKTSTVARYRVDNGAITTASDLKPTPNIYADIIANTAARHTHGNKSVLDGITAKKVSKWDNPPTALKNPFALTVKIGDTEVVYDGSAAKTITIGDGREVSY